MSSSLTCVEELKKRAKSGDLDALQQLRDNGFFDKKKPAEEYAVSYAQRRLWILDQMNEDSAAYNMPGAILLEGALDRGAFRRAVEAIVQRHESLRTTFKQARGETLQVIHADVECAIHEIDVSTEPDPEDAARLYARADAERPFDLESGPLFRTVVLQLAARRHVFLFNVHHIVCDEWSVRVLVGELSRLYDAFTQGKESPLAPLRIQYKDYAAWQNQRLAGADAERLKAYWHESLAGELPTLNLPTDRPRPTVLTFDGRTEYLSLDSGVAENITQFGNRFGATPFITLLAFVRVLLHRYTGQEEIIVGSPIANRKHADLEGQIGFFINNLVLRDSVSGCESFNELLQRITLSTQEAYAYQDYPFDRLVDDLHLDRDMSHSPFFDVVVALQHAERGDLRLGDVAVSAFGFDLNVAKYDLTFDFTETGDGILLGINYNTNLFDAGTIHRMSGHFENLVLSALKNPDTPLGKLNLLSESERRRLLVDFNDTAAVYPNRHTIADLFEEQASRTPDRIAVAFEDTSLTYRELNERANRLARVLQQEHHATPGERIAVLMERSHWTVAGLLGILKAGCTYVPLDPDYPEDRLRYMCADASCRLILADEVHTALAQRIAPDGHDGWTTVDVRVPNRVPGENLSRDTDPSDGAYVIYTSGSTGRPKGCVVTHRNVVRLMKNERFQFDFNENDTWVVAHSFCFDFSVWEMYGALLYGGCVVVARREDVKDVEAFRELLLRHRVTVLNQTPAAFQNLIAYETTLPTSDLASHLRYVIFGGDRLDPTALRPWIQRYPLGKTKLINMYGITETTVHVTYYEITEEDVLEAPGRSPIGRPIPETTVHVCNQWMEPQPTGVVGEIYVGGTGVCQGYLNRPELNEERFIESPFRPGERLYRTGDLGRWLPAGTLEHLGRNDDQVQLRGFRIELGEIQSALNQHPAVQESVVVAQGDDPSQIRLVGYFVPDANHAGPVRRIAELLTEGRLTEESLYDLPNGMQIANLNKSETEFLYDEIFEKDSYFRNGIVVHEGDTVFDVGANIGLFTLYLGSRRKNLSLYAFEPIPPLYELLCKNIEIHGLPATPERKGLSHTEGKTEFTFYRHNSVLSGRFADEDAAAEVVKKYLLQKQHVDGEGGAEIEACLDELLAARLEREKYTCRLTTLSAVMRERGIERIDLLKIDVEKSELEVLEGIQETDWPKIQQIVVEVHESEGRLQHIETMLRGRGFQVVTEREDLLEETGLFNVFARRALASVRGCVDAPRSSTNDVWYGTASLIEEMRDSLRGKLPEYMIPAVFVRLDSIPLTANGKIDRRALPEPEDRQAPSASSTEPRNERERTLCKIWSELLGRERIGIHDNFFDLGGHSLKATQMVARIHRDLGGEIGLRNVFRSPTVAALAEVIGRTDPTQFSSIQPVPRADHYPVSNAQRRLWVIEGMGAERSAYNIVSGSLLEGDLEIECLRAAVESLVERHESLRTTFAAVDDRPCQYVHDKLDIDFQVIDLQSHSDPLCAARERAERDAGEPFDLERGPLFRVRLYRVASRRQVLAFQMHHIISDGWSMGVFFRELQSLYNAFAEGRGNPLEPLRIQYKDFAAWQNALLDGPGVDAHRDHWHKTFEGGVPVLELPLDRPRPSVQTFHGELYEFEIDSDSYRRLLYLGREHDASAFMAVSALVRTLLYHYTGQVETVIGSPIAYRDHVDLENQIGFYVNMLPLRDRIETERGFQDVLQRSRDTVAEASEHQIYPFDRLVEELNLQRDMGRSPLFDVAVSLQNAEKTDGTSGRLRVAPFEIQQRISKFDLTFFFSEKEAGGCEVAIEYSTDLFSPERIERVAEHLNRLLQSVLAAPTLPVRELDILADAERQKVVETFNHTEREYPQNRSIASLFEEQSERNPDRPAVIYGEKRLTYRELNEYANGLARHLQDRLRIQPEEPIAVLLDRSERTAIALLGILKAGGAYVPIDPAYPQSRIAYILKDTACRVSIAEEKLLRNRQEVFRNVETIDLDTVHLEPAPNPPAVGEGSSLAYVIYTSGSTGTPKGSLIEQKSVLRLVLNPNYIDINENDRILQTGSLAFDASTFEIWGALLNGACLCLPESGALLEADEMRALIDRHGVTTMFLTTSLFNQFVEADVAMFRGLKTLLMGGEKVSVDHVNRLLDACPAVAFSHVYGPTENTTFTTHYRVDGPAELDVPIGAGISNTTVYILDRHNRPAPIGVPGEICTGGDGLARGYLNRPELTAETFIESPFRKGERLYRTGDLGVWREDGNVTFLGRIDDQVKVRGFRVEPGEIENHLSAHPQIKEAVVVARETSVGTRSLAAYFTSDAAIGVESLRTHLAGRLPDYMIPSHFTPLDRIPLNVNGKVDKPRLPAPDEAAEESAGAFAAPRNEIENLLASIWRAVLGRERIGIYDNYFDLGGDSIRAIQIVSRVRREGWQLAVRDLFENLTVAELAKKVQKPDALEETAPVSGSVLLTPIQRWFLDAHTGDLSHFNQSVLLRSEARLDESNLRAVLDVIVSHHDASRMRFHISGETVEQSVDEPGRPADFSVVDCQDSPARLESHANDIQRSFDLESGPLFKAVLYHMPDGDRLLLVAHHLVVDGVSWRILLEDVERGYRQRQDGEPVDLGMKTASFQRWSEDIRRYASSERLQQECSHWATLAELDCTPLPHDGSGRNNAYGECETAHLRLTNEETEALLTATHRAYHTETNDILLTALGRALKRWHGCTATWLTLEGHGREPLDSQLDLSRTVGWFTSMFPFRLVAEGEEIGKQIKQVKEALRCVPSKGIGFGILCHSAPEELRLDPAVMPQPQISFNYLGQFDESGERGAFAFADESPGQNIAPRLQRQHDLDISGIVVRGGLDLSISYHPSRHTKVTVEKLLAEFRDELRYVTGHCRSHSVDEKTPADFASGVMTLTEYETFLNSRNWSASEIEDIYHLSPMQEGLLFQTLYQEDSSAYFLQTSYTLDGALDVDAFERSWNQLCQRHAVFRTAFVHEGRARPIQVVFKSRQPEYSFFDLRGQSGAEQRERIENYKRRDMQRRFDLERDALVRVTVFRIGESRYQVVWSYHHLLLDGWCLSLVYQDLTRIYAALLQGLPPELPDVPAYSNYIRWLEESDRERAVGYWREAIGDYEHTAAVPRLPDADSSGGYELEQHFLSFDETASAGLAEIAARYGVSLNTLVQAVWAVLLSRYNDLDDVVFGAIVSGRPAGLQGVEEMIGLFINAIPVRVQIGKEQTFGELLMELQRTSLDGEPYHYLPLTEIHSQSPVGRDLFDHLLIFANYPVESDAIQSGGAGQDGLAVRDVESHDQTHYDFNLIVIPGKELCAKFHTNARVYPKKQVESVAAHFEAVVRDILQDAERPVCDIDILPGAERARLTLELAAGPTANLNDGTILDTFATRLAESPASTAVVCRDVRLSYAELNRCANRIANYLQRECKVTADTRVSLLLDRSEWVVAAVLGVLKSGAAYVPIAPEYPNERIGFILKDSDCAVLLTEEKYLERFAAGNGTLAVDVRTLARGDDTEPERTPVPSDLAYIIYTSGSTGNPKGCQIEHRNLYHYLSWANRYYFPNERNGNFGLYSSLSFDLTVTSLFSSLLRGKTLTVFPSEMEIGEILKESFQSDSPIDSIKLTPSHITLLRELDITETNVCLAIVGGEALLVEQVRLLHGLNPDMAVYNEYGPTEATVGCIIKRVEPDEGRVLIGKPIDNTQIYILDSRMAPAPVGAPGELYIGGAGVARGYLHRDDLNAKCFIGNPFCKGERLYRTGDKARWLPDTNIDFLGRIDDQIKIRGHRIEPAEIECCLAQHESVDSVAVVARDDEGQGPELIAYLVFLDDCEIPSLKAYLRGRLPEYMIPTHFVDMERLPLNPNGKIDRRKLPDPAECNMRTETVCEPPRNDWERRLLPIWQNVLQMESIGVTDHFFDLGGHSLKAMQLTYRIQREFGVNLSLHTLFEVPTIESLAVRLQTAGIAESSSIEPAPEREEYALSHAQERLWLLHQMKGETAYNMPKAVLFKRLLDVEALKAAFQALMERHEALRTAFVLVDGEPRQRILDRVDFDISEVDLRTSDDPMQTAREIADREAVRSFDLERPPLLRAALMALPDSQYVFLLVIHHIIGDGWSMNVLYREILSLYQAFHDGRRPSLKPLGIQYKDFAEWQNGLFFKREERYWLKELAHAPAQLRLPYDVEADGEPEFHGATEERTVPADVVRGLRALASEKGTTLSNVVLSVFQLFLYQLTKQDDFCVGVSVANRTHADLENLIGFFVNILPIRMQLSADLEFDELLDRVVEKMQDAFECQDYPFDLLVQKLNPDRVGNRQPFLNVIYAFQNFDDLHIDPEESDLGPQGAPEREENALLALEPFEVTFETSKFDLTLFITAMGEALLFSLEYDTALFQRSTIQWYLETLERFACTVAEAQSQNEKRI